MRARAGRTWHMPWGTFWVAALALTGVLLLLYPTTASWFAQAEQSRLIDETNNRVAELDPVLRNQQLDEARAYNLALTGGAIVQAGTHTPIADELATQQFQVLREEGVYDYSELLSVTDDGVMARLKIASIRLDLPVYHGTGDDTLEKGVGHLEGTALPVGGNSIHSVLTAHRGLPGAELFNRLDEVRIGDLLTVETAGDVFVYRVTQTRVVSPDQTEALRPQAGRDLLTLITCTPLGVNTHRILVTGERVTPTPIAEVTLAGTTPNIPGFPWWAVGVSGSILLLTTGVWRAGMEKSPRN